MRRASEYVKLAHAPVNVCKNETQKERQFDLVGAGLGGVGGFFVSDGRDVFVLV